MSLPSLTGIPAKLTYNRDNSKLLPVAAALIEQKYATEEMWDRTLDLSALVQSGLDVLLEREGSATASAHMELYPTLTDEHNSDPASSQLCFQLQVGNCGYFCIGKPLEAMEETAAGLGGAFYCVLSRSIWTFGEAYDIDRARESADYQRECAEQDQNVDKLTPEQESQYEFWDPEKAIPASVLDAVNDRRKGHIKARLAMLRKHSDGPHQAWIQPLLRIAKLADRYRKTKIDELEEAPLPSFLICFKPHDDIVAAFDDYAQSAMESDQSTVYLKWFDTKKPSTIAQALHSLRLITSLYAATSSLADAMRESDEG